VHTREFGGISAQKKSETAESPQAFHGASTVFQHAIAPTACSDRLTRAESPTTLRSFMQYGARVIFRRRICAVALACAAAIAAPAAAAESILYRIFLTDGSTLVSYGEFARVAGRVVFSAPIGSVSSGALELQLVSVAETAVDWPRTDQYAEAVRARRYADTKGEEEFAKLSAQVARTLSDVSATTDPAKRVDIVVRARQMLAEWPLRNYGYRSRDVAELSSLLDEVLAGLRAAAGQPRMELSLVAETVPPPAVDLLPDPSLRETIEQAFSVARLTPEATERVALLEAVVRALQPATKERWAAALHARAAADLALELKTEAAYADLSRRTLAAAEERAGTADVRGVEQLIERVLRTDDRLGRKRPQATSALLATLDRHLAAARRVRLERDAWAARLKVLKSYERSIASPLKRFRESIEGLEEIKALAGPSASTLATLARRTAQGLNELGRMKTSADLQGVHDLLMSAFQMAGQAIAARQAAIRTTSMEIAWRASSAAAGALLLFERATADLERLAAPPRQ
jgi:hypothetical protein